MYLQKMVNMYQENNSFRFYDYVNFKTIFLYKLLITITIYDDVNHTNELDRITYKDVAPNISLDEYLDRAATYEYHFVKQNERFIYKSFERVG